MPHHTDEPRASGTAPLRVLVTGGAGFIGSHLVDVLAAQGAHVTVIDNLSTGRRSNLAHHLDADGHDDRGHPLRDRVRFIEADLGRALDALGDGEIFDEIYHLAAAVGVQLILAEPIRAIETNVGESSAVLRFAHEHGNIPVLIASSSEVYGKSTRVPFREDDDVAYGPTTASRWSYACSKAIDEYLALAHHAQHKLPCVIARFFNTVGPRQVGDYGMVLPRFVKSALAGEALSVFGDGTQSRCFCDARDVASVLPRLLASTACHGRVFNVGSEQALTIADLARRVISVLGSTSKIVMTPYDRAYAPGFEDLLKRVPDVSRLRSAVGFEPRIPLDQTIRDLADWMIATGALRVRQEART